MEDGVSFAHKVRLESMRFKDEFISRVNHVLSSPAWKSSYGVRIPFLDCFQISFLNALEVYQPNKKLHAGKIKSYGKALHAMHQLSRI